MNSRLWPQKSSTTVEGNETPEKTGWLRSDLPLNKNNFHMAKNYLTFFEELT